MRAGHARLDQGDVGAMHPIGTRETLDGMTLSKYAVGKKVSSQLSRRFVHILARIGSVVFPDVLSVIQDTEGDAGVRPAADMAGDVKGNRVGGSIDMLKLRMHRTSTSTTHPKGTVSGRRRCQFWQTTGICHAQPTQSFG